MIPCLFNIGTGEVIIIVVVILLLFGAKRIPELARSIGKGINSFKQGMNEVSTEITNNAPTDSKADSKNSSTTRKEESEK